MYNNSLDSLNVVHNKISISKILLSLLNNNNKNKNKNKNKN